MKISPILAGFLGCILGTSIAMAQAPQARQKQSITLDGARKVIQAASAAAQKAGATGVFAVVDDGGNLVALDRLDGTFPAGANISIGKARTAAMFKKPTKFFEDVIAKGRTSMVALADFTPLQGGVPILVDGEVIGAIGVSGASSAQQDEELAMAGAEAIGAVPEPVTYFDRKSVEEAFARGAVLFAENQKYMVHASRREKPGIAEIHTEDADIVHVLDGSATIVTGGEAVDVKMTAPGEFRGSSIRNGEERVLAKGDVIVIPAGTPHWFKEVSNPFLYYVVKAR